MLGFNQNPQTLKALEPGFPTDNLFCNYKWAQTGGILGLNHEP